MPTFSARTKRLRMPPRVVVAAVAAAVVLSPTASAQVYKCVDANGRTTYQQAPCAAGQQGRAVTLQPENGSSRGPDAIAAWNAAVAERRVVNGMPRNWVIQALGTPSEKRAARSGENGTEVWAYADGKELLRVGFIGDAVAWTRRDAMQGAEAPRNLEARDKVAAGQSCGEVRNTLGPADREEPAPETDPAGARASTIRYVYEPPKGEKGIRLSFTCIEDKVIDVARSLSTR